MKRFTIALSTLFAASSIIGLQLLMLPDRAEAKSIQGNDAFEVTTDHQTKQARQTRQASLASRHGVVARGLASSNSPIYDGNGNSYSRTVASLQPVFIVGSSRNFYSILMPYNRIGYISKNNITSLLSCTGNSSRLTVCQPSGLRQ